MTRLSMVVGVSAIGVMLLFAGCATSHNSWELSREDMREIRGLPEGQVLSTNDYSRVPDSQMDAAVAMLQNVSFVHLDPEQVTRFAPSLPARDSGNLQPYLVRGLTFTAHPIYTVVKFDGATGRLLVKQASYNGEMLLPYGHPESNALAVWLPRPPAQIYPAAVMGGDGVWAGGTDHR